MNGSEPLLTYQQSRDLDEKTMKLGWSSTQLMGQAALSSLYLLKRHRTFSRIIILCGPGNNGGDGLALAWHILSSAGQNGWGADASITVVQTGAAKSEAAKFYEGLPGLLENLKVQQYHHLNTDEFLDSLEQEKTFAADLRHGSDRWLIVDALLGSGQNRPLEGTFARLASWMAEKQSQGAYLLALDVPTGLLEDRSYSETAHYYPDEIHSYGPHRLACMFDSELLKSSMHACPIGFAPDLNSRFRLVKRNQDRLIQFNRSLDSHKYSNGSAWLLGGSSGMEGAMILSARCFFASGGGILQALSHSEKSLISDEPSIMQKESLGLDSRVGAITLGPGCSREDCQSFLAQLSKQWSQSEKSPFLILDAGAAVESIYPSKAKVLHGRKTLLTPHPGEWSALGGSAIHDVASLETAMDLTRDHIGSYVLYKGSTSILIDPFENRAYLFPWANTSLAVAGTGDCLTGILMSALSRSSDMISSVMASMELLHSSSEIRVHPRSSQIPALIQKALKRLNARAQDSTGKGNPELTVDGQSAGGLH